MSSGVFHDRKVRKYFLYIKCLICGQVVYISCVIWKIFEFLLYFLNATSRKIVGFCKYFLKLDVYLQK